MKGYNNSNVLIVDSFYTLKDLEITNLKRTLSNLFKNANYQNVLDGYEKFYNDNGSLESEKTYKNGKLIDTKTYDAFNINADTLKNISNSKVQNSNNSYKSNENNNYNTINKTNNEKENLDDKSSKDEKGNLLYVLFISIILILSLIAIIYEFFFKKNKKNKKKKLKYFEYIDLGDRKAVRYKGNLLNSSINYKILCNRKNILLFINYKNGSPTNIKFSVSNYYIDIDIETTPQEICSEYEDNEVSADNKYKGKKVAITGTIERIIKSGFSDDPIIVFKGTFIKDVRFYFSKDSNNEISNLSKGDKITIVGTCKGMTLGDVVLHKCKILE